MNIDEHVSQKIRRRAIVAELIPAALLVAVLYFMIELGHPGVAPLAELVSCGLPLWSGGDDSFAEVGHSLCTINMIAELAGYVLFPYLALCLLLIASPLQTSPVLWFMGIYLETQDGKRPTLAHALRFILLSRSLITLYITYAYFWHFDFALTMHGLFKIFILSGALAAGLALIDAFSSNPHTWDERVSDLSYKLTGRAKRKHDKEVKRYKARWDYKIALPFERYHVSPILNALLLFFVAMNILRESPAPADYDRVVYERPPMTWENNAYFALAGLDAPEGVEDFAAYGREKTIYHAQKYTRFKKRLNIPFVRTVPESNMDLYDPAHFVQHLHFDNAILDSARCIYTMRAAQDDTTRTCPNAVDIWTQYKQENPTLWERFQNMPDGIAFSTPDVFFDAPMTTGKDFINLAKLKAIQIMALQQSGQTDKALREWERYMKFYLTIVSGTRGSLVEKATVRIPVGIQMDALETLLYHDPSLAVSHGAMIKEILAVDDAEFFHSGMLLADDWGVIEPWVMSITGKLSFQRQQLYACFQENKAVATLSAKEYMQHKDIPYCETYYPRDVHKWMLKAVTDPGDPVTNIMHSLVMGGLLKGRELIEHAHHQIAEFKMAHAGIDILQNALKAGDIQAYLDSVPEVLENPINESPFLWDAQKGWLYYDNPDHPELEPHRVFYLNIPD